MRRIVREQLVHAAASLTDPDDCQAAVHEARKSFKKIRAALRLVRDEIGHATYRAENIRLRDAGRRLSEVRDSWVFVQTLDDLARHLGEFLTPETLEPVRRRLLRRHERITAAVFDRSGTAEAVIRTIEDMLRCSLPAADIRDEFDAVEGGLRRVYRRGFRRHKEVLWNPSAESLHAWRKRVKYLRYHCDILMPLWPGVVGQLHERAKELGELLGDDHDLVELRRTLIEEPSLCAGQVRRELLIALIDRRRAELQAQAMPLGARLYAERPGAFVRRFAVYWEVWRAEEPKLCGPEETTGTTAADAGETDTGMSLPDVVDELRRLTANIREIFDVPPEIGAPERAPGRKGSVAGPPDRSVSWSDENRADRPRASRSRGVSGSPERRTHTDNGGD